MERGVHKASFKGSRAAPDGRASCRSIYNIILTVKHFFMIFWEIFFEGEGLDSEGVDWREREGAKTRRKGEEGGNGWALS